MHYVLLLGRILFSFLFIACAMNHFSSDTVAFATNHGIPFANALVPLSGIVALFGGLSILLGYHAKIGASLLIIFLVITTFAMHNFWNLNDPMAANLQKIMFMKNLSLVGACLLITYFGSGPCSIDKNKRKK